MKAIRDIARSLHQKLEPLKFSVNIPDLPTYKGSTFRGGFGHAFRSMVCTMKKTDCTNCLLKEQCPYSYIFETSPGHRSEVLNNFEEVPRPYVIEPPPGKKTFYKSGEKNTL